MNVKGVKKHQFDISYSHHSKIREPKTGLNKTHKVAITTQERRNTQYKKVRLTNFTEQR